ncbi:uncharacterized protein LOC106093793 [Stomoxys calcitrans]|uniref:uncharacterized protein LOC106093793 n=1 Tax=Stomoxys calcitrans TaxID=35570 RepID=UPI0027E331A4|nr:uncharacterized protein LOC106093793 [Stomoxys calcitrans]XP_059218885.1 uncharacterized protein LOC106093793 [Stomoxys calcitrans]
MSTSTTKSHSNSIYLLTVKVFTRFENKRNYFERPRLVGIYNIDHIKFNPAHRIKNHFKEPEPSSYPLDLNASEDLFGFLKYETQTNLFHPLLHAVFSGTSMLALEEERAPTTPDDIERTNVYTRRGILERIMEFCYTKYSFTVCVSRCNGKLFMVQQAPKKNVYNDNQSVHHMRLSQLVFGDPTGKTSNGKGSMIYDDNVFQVLVHKTSLGKFDIYYVGRTQGIIPDKAEQKINDLETLNGQRFVAVKQMLSELRNDDLKLLKYWLQGYLSNIKEIYIAYKDSDGIVREPLEYQKLSDIPKKCSWKPNVCTSFLLEFLNRVENLMSDVDSLDTVYRFTFNAKYKTVYYQIHEGKSDYSFIPHEYGEFIQE